MERERRTVHVELSWSTRLRFGPEDPVRAASALVPLRDGWLVAQDDANHGAWWRPEDGTVRRIRLLPPNRGLDVFSATSGTKHLKPDLEAACMVRADGDPAALLLGSGSLPARTRAVLVRDTGDDLDVRAADLAPLYERARAALGVHPQALNLEGACVVGDRLRWFQRGHGPSGVASASVDLDLAGVVAAIHDDRDPATIEVGEVRRYELGCLGGLPLAITDAVTLHDGRTCVSAAAEDAPDAVADGPVAGSVLGLVGEDPVSVELLPLPARVAPCKVEGLAVLRTGDGTVRLIAVVDDDDPQVASLAMELVLTRG